MTTFEHWILKRIFKKQVTQGGHFNNIQELYTMIRDAAAEEFTEDNQPTIDAFLQDAFDETKFSKVRLPCECSDTYCRQKAEFDAQC
jgi:hypothetical protein